MSQYGNKSRNRGDKGKVTHETSLF
jgi:hypothetical protein